MIQKEVGSEWCSLECILVTGSFGGLAWVFLGQPGCSLECIILTWASRGLFFWGGGGVVGLGQSSSSWSSHQSHQSLTASLPATLPKASIGWRGVKQTRPLVDHPYLPEALGHEGISLYDWVGAP